MLLSRVSRERNQKDTVIVDLTLYSHVFDPIMNHRSVNTVTQNTLLFEGLSFCDNNKSVVETILKNGLNPHGRGTCDLSGLSGRYISGRSWLCF